MPVANEPIRECPFCAPLGNQVFLEDPLALALWDRYPVSPGHCLIVPRRHFPGLFQATADEALALWKLAAQAHDKIRAQHSPDGFNIGINDGIAAGQTVLHAHLRIIPRYAGDAPDPRGGIRWVIPSKADYWNGR